MTGQPISSKSANSASSAAPKGLLAVWFRRLANVGFAIAAAYCVFLISMLFLASQKNSEFVGKPIGSFELERISEQGALVTTLLEGPGAHKRAFVLWATWSGPCHSLLVDLRDRVSAGAIDPSKIYAVSITEPLADVAAFMESNPIPFNVMLDRQGLLAQAMKLSGTPTVVLVNADGTIASASTGGFGLASKIEAFVSER